MSMLSISKKGQGDTSLIKVELEVSHNIQSPPTELLVLKTLKSAEVQHESGEA